MTGARAKGTQTAGVPAVILATGNRGKAREFERLLGGVLTVEPLPAPVVLPEETGETSENARAEAEAARCAGRCRCTGRRPVWRWRPSGAGRVCNLLASPGKGQRTRRT